jgi:hypothetical protein
MARPLLLVISIFLHDFCWVHFTVAAALAVTFIASQLSKLEHVKVKGVVVPVIIICILRHDCCWLQTTETDVAVEGTVYTLSSHCFNVVHDNVQAPEPSQDMSVNRRRAFSGAFSAVASLSNSLRPSSLRVLLQNLVSSSELPMSFSQASRFCLSTPSHRGLSSSELSLSRTSKPELSGFIEIVTGAATADVWLTMVHTRSTLSPRRRSPLVLVPPNCSSLTAVYALQ